MSDLESIEYSEITPELLLKEIRERINEIESEGFKSKKLLISSEYYKTLMNSSFYINNTVYELDIIKIEGVSKLIMVLPEDCLRIDIDESMIKDSIKRSILEYKRNCYSELVKEGYNRAYIDGYTDAIDRVLDIIDEGGN